ncbi:hypothetical protein [Hyphomonas sp.]|uniref:hypothetical protein n=1 Tax=Hyphomonas sp. TaxID=87 RepID=UPI0032EF36AA
MISPPTLEAPPPQFGVWPAQRLRWLWGFPQIWCDLMRRPRNSIRVIGLAGFVSIRRTPGALGRA